MIFVTKVLHKLRFDKYLFSGRYSYEIKNITIVLHLIIFKCRIIEAGRVAAAQIVTVKPTGCGFDPHSRR